ncbi:hypothetical protein DUI87_08578 [Hirundo rustica rustica]|uniref:G-protein coupled receptors family 1 profile domain-containing protein n=1 Tax=Hirundo rustica rustica TaxID=333673 RepID=A0A3M0KJS6_HIRRU|nr:hypothetical protein DUI87_08578 [Hirundo rustica rustica]
MRSLNITPEQFAQLLRDNNVTREQFIALYGLQPLVYIPELPGRTKVAFVLICVLIFALALFGNCLVLYVVTRSKAMRTVTNIFICSLALSDLLIAFFCVPFTMLQNISSNWLGGAFACKMVPFVQSTAVVTEILTMTCIALERHQGIVHPLKMKWQYTNKRAFTMLGNFEKEYDDVTIKMIFAIVQIIGFFNSICNPIVYAFMNENFKKNFLSALCFCILKDGTSPGRQLGNSGITMRLQKPSASRRGPMGSDEGRREAFSDGNIEVKFCDQPASKRNLKRHLVLFSSELTVHSAVGNGQ